MKNNSYPYKLILHLKVSAGSKSYPSHVTMETRPQSYVTYDRVTSAVDALTQLSHKAADLTVKTSEGDKKMAELCHPVEAAIFALRTHYETANVPTEQQDLPPYISAHAKDVRVPADVLDQPGVMAFQQELQAVVANIVKACLDLEAEPIYPTDHVQPRPPHGYVGDIECVTYGSGPHGAQPLLDKLMPGSKTEKHESTGLVTTTYTTQEGQLIKTLYHDDVEAFMEIARTGVIPEGDYTPKQSQDMAPEDAKAAAKEIKAYFSKGSGIRVIDLPSDDPAATATYFACDTSKYGFVASDYCEHGIRFDEHSPFSFRFVATPKERTPNPEALAIRPDHMVVNGRARDYQKHTRLLPQQLWSGPVTALRHVEANNSAGVEFYTGVHYSRDRAPVLPFNFLHPLEEAIASLAVEGHAHTPKHLLDPAKKNQITIGWVTTNATDPTHAGSPFLQHFAFSLGDKVFEVADSIRAEGGDTKLLPAPDNKYYEDTEATIGQRVAMLPLLHTLGIPIQEGELPDTFYDCMLHPETADLSVVKKALIDGQVPEAKRTQLLEALKNLQPVFKDISTYLSKNKMSETPLESDTLVAHLKAVYHTHLQKDLSDDQASDIANRLILNRNYLIRAQRSGLLADYNSNPAKTSKGYLFQSFTGQITKATEGRIGAFHEITGRRCSDEIEADLQACPNTSDIIGAPTKERQAEHAAFRKHAEAISNVKSVCGLFGQGNFSQLMLFMQRHLEQHPIKPGDFVLPLLNKAELEKDPLGSMKAIIQKVREGGNADVATALESRMHSVSAVLQAAAAA